jgi:hypothetical protein
MKDPLLPPLPSCPAVGDGPTLVKLPDGRVLTIRVDLAHEAETTELRAAPLAIPPALLREPRGDAARLVPREPVAKPPSADVLDHEAIGGRFTLCVLLYGDYHPLHRRCLESIRATTTPDRLELRVATNAACRETLDLVSGLLDAGVVRKHYFHRDNDRKYPVMRQMFHDRDDPIGTRWAIWFDDDTLCDRNRDWLRHLARAIVSHPGAAMFGAPRFSHMSRKQADWLRAGRWHRKRPMRDRHGKETPNGNVVHFCVGACFCVLYKAVKTADLPDERLGHNGGDACLGEQLWQHGYRLKAWSDKKDVVNWSSVPRRGITEPFMTVG